MIHLINAIVFILAAVYIYVLDHKRQALTVERDTWRTIAKAHAAELSPRIPR